MYAINGTYIIFAALFLVFIYLLNEIMLKPVCAAMEKRQAKVQEDYATAKSCGQEAQKILSDYQAKLQESRLQAQSIIQAASAEANREKEEKLNLIQAQGRARLDDLKNELANERQNLLRALIDPELKLVDQITRKLLGENVPELVTGEERVLQTFASIR